MGIPYFGLLNVTKATKNAMMVGNGCGKSGMSDRPSIMLASVITNAKILSGFGSSARSFSSFSLFLCFRALYHALTPELVVPFVDFNYYDLKPYFIKSLLKLVVGGAMEGGELHFDVLENIGKHIDLLKPVLPEQAAVCVFDVVESIGKHIELLKPVLIKQTAICVGEYPTKILLRELYVGKINGMLPIFIGKSSKDIAKWSRSSLDPNSILGLDTDIDTHFWFHVLPYVTKDDEFIGRLRKLVDDSHDTIIVSSLWDGVGSALLPALISQFKTWNINSVALGVLPSKVQPSDVHFNALASVGMCASKDFATVLLVDRDHLESYVGVSRDGSTLKGNLLVNYALDLMLAKETLVQELTELSRSFSVKVYTILAATGASLQIYGSLENMLNTALIKPLLTFDLSSASLLYVLLRMPLQLRDTLPRGKIELAVANWFKERVSLKSIYVSEPIYVEEVNDRIDVVMFVGGFNVTEMFASLEKKVSALKSQTIKKGFVKEDEWRGIVKSLVED
jgi:hypothetical protein